jgi:hypothetical protein
VTALLTAGIEDAKGAVPPRELEGKLYALELAEERVVMAAFDAGLEVHRRIDASPWAILFAAGMEDETPVAEAAE